MIRNTLLHVKTPRNEVTSAYLIIRYYNNINNNINNNNITESISILEIVKQVTSIASKTKLSVVCVIRLFLVRNSF